MKSYRFCKTKHNPPESYGDCVKACIDTILDRDDTPHVFDERNGEESWEELRKWLASIDYAPFITMFDPSLSLNEFFEEMKTNNPESVYMLLAQSAGSDHCIICQGGEIVHNPAWYKQPINGPHSIGAWITIVIGKI